MKIKEEKKLTKLLIELKYYKNKKWNIESELIRIGDKIRKIELKLDKELKNEK